MITVNESTETGITIIRPGPKLTHHTSRELLKLIQSVSTAATPGVIVSLQGTKILDSSGIGALVSGMKYIRQMNGTFVLVALPPEISRMIQLMNLHHVFTIYDTVERATEQLTGSGT